MNVEELKYISNALVDILKADKATRESGEEKLKQIKASQPDKYACYLVSILQQGKSSDKFSLKHLTSLSFIYSLKYFL